MKTWSNWTKNIVYVSLFVFIILGKVLAFVFSLKFDKKYSCQIQSIYNDEYIVVDKKVAEYLNQTKKQQILEYKNIRYYFKYKFYKKLDDRYLFITNLNLDLNKGTQCFILIDNVNVFELLK